MQVDLGSWLVLLRSELFLMLYFSQFLCIYLHYIIFTIAFYCFKWRISHYSPPKFAPNPPNRSYFVDEQLLFSNFLPVLFNVNVFSFCFYDYPSSIFAIWGGYIDLTSFSMIQLVYLSIWPLICSLRDKSKSRFLWSRYLSPIVGKCSVYFSICSC